MRSVTQFWKTIILLTGALLLQRSDLLYKLLNISWNKNRLLHPF